MTDLTVSVGVGVGDLQLAAGRELQRIMREAGGDRRKAVQLVLEKLRKLGLISEAELGSLSKVCQLDFDSAAGSMPPEKAYVEVRRIYDEMLAGGQASPTALALASASAGSYVSVEEVGGEPSVVFKKAGTNWQSTLAGAGALIGSALGGPGGAAIGGAIGGVAGKVVDDCLA
jgi:hypothetical protein